tara:strand:- start:107 stop:349 length:243 start_codon:yes stop_codon:yes gene_type:complete
MSTMINLRTCKELLRDRRDMFLRDSDWTQFNDSPLSKAKKTAWATYRQELRDLPANNPDPKWEDGDETKLPDIDWPTKPE